MSVSISATARRLTAVTAVAAACVGAATLPAAAADHHHAGRGDRARVVISGVQYDSPGRDDRSNRSLNREWVEITNTGRRAVDLDGWTLSDEDGHTYTFDDVRLEGRDTVRIHTGVGRDSDTDLYQDRRNYVWDNDEDTATLYNDRGRFVDDESWGRHYRDGGWDHRHGGWDHRHGGWDHRHGGWHGHRGDYRR